MKILAVSDWRIQPVELISQLIQEHNIDVLLYAGDDLSRLVRPTNLFVSVGKSNLVAMSRTQVHACSRLSEIWEQYRHNPIRLSVNGINIWEPTQTPVYYVYGNDDSVLTIDARRFIKIYPHPWSRVDKWRDIVQLAHTLSSTPPHRGKSSDLMAGAAGGKNIRLAQTLPLRVRDSVLVELSPVYGRTMVKAAGQQIVVFASECTAGVPSKVVRVPNVLADIYLSHIPPLGVLDLSVRFGVEHIGDRRLREAVINLKPKVVLCGHSHFWGGYEAKLGNTKVVNISSQDNRGYKYTANYAIINTEDWSVDVRTHYSGSNRTGVRGFSTLRKNILNLVGSGKLNLKESRELIKLADEFTDCSHSGIRNVDQLVERLRGLERFGLRPQRVIDRLQSMQATKPEIQRRLAPIPGTFAYCDTETGLASGEAPGRLWLVGLLFGDSLVQFDWRRESKRFFDYISHNHITRLLCWSRFDSKILRPRLRQHSLSVQFLDLCQRVSRCVVWHQYSLDDLHKAMMPERHVAKPIEGRVAGILADHIIFRKTCCKFCPQRAKVEAKVRERNRLDLLQMRDIYECLVSFTDHISAAK